MLCCKGGDFTKSTAGWLDQRPATSNQQPATSNQQPATSDEHGQAAGLPYFNKGNVNDDKRPTTNGGSALSAVACGRLRQGAGVSGRGWNHSLGRRPLDMTTAEQLYAFANL